MKNPSYITKNRLGIYYFQYSYTQNRVVDGRFKRVKRLFRKSLRTRSQTDALLTSRHLWLIVEMINKKYFKNSENYGRAMQLLAEYEVVEKMGWKEVDDFYAELDDLDMHLLKNGALQKQEDESLTKNQLKIYKRLLEKFQGNQTQDNKFEAQKENPQIQSLVKTWISEKQKTLKVSSLETAKHHIDIFCKVLMELKGGDFGIRELTPDLIRRFNVILENLPARRNSKLLINKKFSELVKSKDPKISPKTYHYHINTTIEFLNWLESHDYIDNTKLKTILQSSKKTVPKKSTNIRDQLSDSDLKKIFESDKYLKGDFKHSSDYWVPLIAIFTGARLGEICQLTTSDITVENKAYCIDINEEGEGKSIKSKIGSARTIPIHKTLIKLGFIEYVEELKERNQTKLFPYEKRNSLNKFDAIQKRMKTFFTKVGIVSTEKQTKTFHSFRHTVRTRLVDLNIDERTIDSIVGHSSNERSIGSKVYTHSNLMSQKIEAIKKLTFEITFEKIRNWKNCLFKRREVDLLK